MALGRIQLVPTNEFGEHLKTRYESHKEKRQRTHLIKNQVGQIRGINQMWNVKNFRLTQVNDSGHGWIDCASVITLKIILIHGFMSVNVRHLPQGSKARTSRKPHGPE